MWIAHLSAGVLPEVDAFSGEIHYVMSSADQASAEGKRGQRSRRPLRRSRRAGSASSPDRSAYRSACSTSPTTRPQHDAPRLPPSPRRQSRSCSLLLGAPTEPDHDLAASPPPSPSSEAISNRIVHWNSGDHQPALSNQQEGEAEDSVL